MNTLSLRALRDKAFDVRKKLGTKAAATFVVRISRELEGEARMLPNFMTAEAYGTLQAEPSEIGCVEVFKFISDKDLPPGQWDLVAE